MFVFKEGIRPGYFSVGKGTFCVCLVTWVQFPENIYVSRIKPTSQCSLLTNTREIWHGYASHTLIKIKLKMKE